MRRARTPDRVLLLAALAGGFGSLDSSVNVAFPSLIDGFGLELGQLRWVIFGYIIPYGGALVAAGRLGDRVGHRRVLLTGAVVAASALTVCASASSFPVFIAGRVAQGFSTAMIMGSAPALIVTILGSGARGRAVGLFQTAAAFGLAVGPVVAGPLLQVGQWRAVYWFRVPVAVILVALALGAAGTGRRPSTAVEPTVVESAAPTRLVTALVGPGPYLWLPLMLATVAYGAGFVIWLLGPSLMIDQAGLGTTVAGLALATSAAATATAARLAGPLVDGDRSGGRRVGAGLAVGGLLLEAVGLAWLWLVAPTSGEGGDAFAWLLVAGFAAVGAGLGMFAVPNMASIMASLGGCDQGLAGALSLLARTAGIVGFVSLATALFNRIDADFGAASAVVFATMSAVLALAAGVQWLLTRPGRRTVRWGPSR